MRIILVDDEPIFLYNLREVIRQCADDLQYPVTIVSEYYSAERALAAIPQVLPDIIFTDIRMDEMDGLEFAQKVHEEWPFIKVIIVSGYPSFDSARIAMKTRAVDYLVKPIEYQGVLEALSHTLNDMKENDYQRNKTIYQALLDNRKVDDTLHEATVQLSTPGLYAIIGVRSSMLKFDPSLHDTHLNREPLLLEPIRAMLEHGEEIWLYPTPDRRGVLLIVTCKMDDGIDERLVKIAAYLLDTYTNSQSKAMVGISDRFTDAEFIGEAARNLLKRIEYNAVIGCSKLLYGDQHQHGNRQSYTLLSDIQLNTLQYHGQKQDWTSMKNNILSLFDVWEKEQCPTIFIEMELRKAVDAAGYRLDPQNPILVREIEQSISDILFDSSNFKDAGQAFVDWLQTFLKPASQRQDTKREILFQQIQQFIITNLAQPINLLTLTEKFEISSTYLCNLFRIYCSCSFLEYFTQLRMDKAKELLTQQAEMPIKDISEIVGYTDRHYFSKIFKSSVGSTPSEYRNQFKNTNGDVS